MSNFWEKSPNIVVKRFNQVERQQAARLAEIESREANIIETRIALKERETELQSFAQLAEERAETASKFLPFKYRPSINFKIHFIFKPINASNKIYIGLLTKNLAQPHIYIVETISI